MTNEEFIAFLRKNVISVACVIVSIGIGFVLYYRNDNLPEAEKVLQERAKQGELLQANIEDSAQLKDQQAAMVSANEDISNRMIRVGQLAENMQYFYRLESATGTKLLDPRQLSWNPPSRNAPKTSFTPIGFAFTAQGDYPQVLDLLRRLENGEHYSRIITCTLHPATTDSRGGPMTMALSLELLGTQ
jgi:hypothetical protein